MATSSFFYQGGLPPEPSAITQMLEALTDAKDSANEDAAAATVSATDASTSASSASASASSASTSASDAATSATAAATSATNAASSASAAATSASTAQAVVDDVSGSGGAALVGYDGGTVQDIADSAKPMGFFTALRAYTGRATSVRITAIGIGGFFLRDDADTTTADNGGTVIVDGSGRRWKRLFDGDVSVRWFGAVADYSNGTFSGTDNTAAFQAAIDYCIAASASLFAPGGSYYFNGGQLVIANKLFMYGEGRDRTQLWFGGSPTKVVRTYAVWRSEYDSGNYAASSDAAIACAFIVQQPQVFITDMAVKTPWDATTNHPLPFDSATDFPTSNYDVGILVQNSDITLERLLVAGPWGSATNTATGAIKLDVTQPGGAVEHVKIHDCETYGRWGLVVEGPHGSGAFPNYADLNAADTRGAGGVSDLLCLGSQFYDTSGLRGVRLTIDGVGGKRVRRFASMSGGMFIDGQANNSAKRQQQITFVRCRWAAVDQYVYYLNFCNRVEFIACHSEYKTGYYMMDGVTLATGADGSIATTVNARRISYIGGEKSGETDNRTFTDSTNGLRLITELGFDNPSPSGNLTAGRVFSGVQVGERSTWTPTLTASTPGTPTYSTQAGSWQRIGNLVFIQGRITMSSITGMVGTLSIGGLPFTCSSKYGSSGDFPLSFGLVSNVTTGSGGIGAYVNDSSKTASLWKITSGGAVASLNVTDLTATSRFDFSGWYVTEDA